MDAVMDAAAEGMTEEEQEEKLAAVLEQAEDARLLSRPGDARGHGRPDGGRLKAEAARDGRRDGDGRVHKADVSAQELRALCRVEGPPIGQQRDCGSVGYRAVGQATESKGEGLLHFAAYQVEATLRLPLMLDEAAFYVVLVDPSPGCDMGGTWSCAVLVEKDESPGMLKFHRERLSVKESQGQVMVKILRVGGACGKVKCRLKTKDGTAIAPKDYQARDELVQLQDGQTELTLPITIMDDDVYEADETFQVILCEPEGGVTFDPTTDGGADKAVATVTIISDEAVRRKVDELAAIVAFNADDARCRPTRGRSSSRTRSSMRGAAVWSTA